MSLANLDGLYKERIIKLLLADDTVVKLINPTPNSLLDIPEVLLGGEWNINGKLIKEQGHIFDHDFVDDTITEQKTFIFVETQVPSIDKYKPYLVDINLYISVFADNRLVRLSDKTAPTKGEMKKLGFHGNRIDMLCARVDELLNGRDNIGLGDIKPYERSYTSVYKPKVGYYGKMLHYYVKGYNTENNECGEV